MEQVKGNHGMVQVSPFVLPASSFVLRVSFFLLRLSSFIFAAMGVGGAWAAEPAPIRLAIPAAGDPFHASLARIDESWNVTLQTETDQRTVAAGDLVRWGGRVDIQRGIVIVLADHGMIVADTLEIDADRLHATCPLWGELNLTLSNVNGVMFAPPTGSRPLDRLLDRMCTGQEKEPRVLLSNGDSIRGQPVKLDELAATVRCLDRDTTLRTQQVWAVVFSARPAAKPPRPSMVCRLGFRDGSVLPVMRATLAGERLRVTTVGGLSLSSQSYIDMRRETNLLQTLQSQVTYLSDLEPLGYRHQPFLTLTWPLGRNRNVRGGQLRALGVVYDKGLGMASASRVVYRLDGKFARFAAQLAIDNGAGQGGSVVYRVFVDAGQGKWLQAYASPTVRGGETPMPVSVDIRGAKNLALVVDYADRADQLDHANWLDARVVK